MEGNILRRFLLTGLMAMLLSTGTAWAGSFEDGVAAYERGEYATAMGIFRPLAIQGDLDA